MKGGSWKVEVAFLATERQKCQELGRERTRIRTWVAGKALLYVRNGCKR